MNQNIDWEAVTTELKREIAALEFRLKAKELELDGLRHELADVVQERDSVYQISEDARRNAAALRKKLAVVVQEKDDLYNDWRPR